MKSNKLLEQIHERMGEKSTGELLTIWKDNDRGLWSDEVFKAIEENLTSRKVPLPAQGQIKKTVPQSQPLGESWEKPFMYRTNSGHTCLCLFIESIFFIRVESYMFGLLCRVLTSREKIQCPNLDQTVHISVIFLVNLLFLHL